MGALLIQTSLVLRKERQFQTWSLR